MRKLILFNILFFYLLSPLYAETNVKNKAMILNSLDADFSWDYKGPISEYKSYDLKVQGISLENRVQTLNNIDFMLEGSLLSGNYGQLVSVYGGVRNRWNINEKIDLGLNFNLGLDHFFKNSSSPYRKNKTNMVSKIGPYLEFNNSYAIGIYNYFSAFPDSVSIKGTILAFYIKF